MAEQQTAVMLAELTTLRVGGPARHLVRAESEGELLDAVRTADGRGTPLLILGGGSNVLVSDAGFDGTVVQIATTGVQVESAAACAGVFLKVAAGHPWDDVVATCVQRGWVGVEALSGIPGLTGATPIQNVGAYGQDVSETIASVRTFDRELGAIKTFFFADCQFGYRTSLFKSQRFRGGPRYVVLDVTFQLLIGKLSERIKYAELASQLGVAVGTRVPLQQVRDTVLRLRHSKGMVLNDADHDTWSAGSFFTNPILQPLFAELLPPDAPRWPQPTGEVKTNAAWLIDHAGFSKGYGSAAASLSTKHTLALTNRGSATAADLMALAVEIRDGVAAKFGVRLVPEPVLVGLDWPS